MQRIDKLERIADVLGLKEEYKTLILPYINKEQPLSLRPMPTGFGDYLPEFNCEYRPSKFLRDATIKDSPELEHIDKFKINIIPTAITEVNLVNKDYIPPIIEEPVSPETKPVPAKRKASTTTKTKKRKKSTK